MQPAPPTKPAIEEEKTVHFASLPAGTYKKGDEFLMLRQSDLAELSRYLGRNITNVGDLLAAARNVSTLNIKGLEGGAITLDPYLLNRLKSRCHGTEEFPKFVRDRVLEQLAAYCGC